MADLEINQYYIGLFEYALKKYRDEKYGFPLNDYTYYALSSIPPYELASRIKKMGNSTLLAYILFNFSKNLELLSVELNQERVLHDHYEIRGKIVTPDESMIIIKKLQQMNIPLMVTTFGWARRYYGLYGDDGLDLMFLRNQIISSYNKETGNNLHIIGNRLVNIKEKTKTKKI